ncbi:MAG: ATP-binding cassette domain-containing protein [Christensenellaceae bacterium]|nr:ATP-binding cassette domain-containing protein [Christensenellaceae bacterium]
MIQIRNIVQSYGREHVLDNISLDIKENAITALIGANGAGKSTLLGVASRLLPVISGEVLLDNINIKSIKTREVAKQIAVLKQTQSLSLKVTINELVEFGRFPHCGGRLKAEDREKIEESIRFMKLNDIRDKFIDELSGGQRQRAFIAMILAQDTKYIFLDEPLNNLDIKYSVEMMHIIRKLVRRLNKTVVVVLHDINFASAYADYIVAMKDGKIINQGSVKEIVCCDVLNNVFDHDFNIIEHDNRRVCLYYGHNSHRHGENSHIHEENKHCAKLTNSTNQQDVLSHDSTREDLKTNKNKMQEFFKFKYFADKFKSKKAASNSNAKKFS